MSSRKADVDPVEEVIAAVNAVGPVVEVTGGCRVLASRPAPVCGQDEAVEGEEIVVDVDEILNTLVVVLVVMLQVTARTVVDVPLYVEVLVRLPRSFSLVQGGTVNRPCSQLANPADTY